MTGFDLSKISEALSEIKNFITRKPVSEVMKAKMEKIKYLKANNWRLGPTTPFPEIDKLTRGFKKGGVVGIGAFSNTGKSQLSYYYAQHFLKNDLSVTYFSLEVDSVDVLTYIQQYYYGIGYEEAATKTDTKGLEKLEIYDVGQIKSLRDIEDYVKEYKPDIIFIDFIQIIKVEGISKEYEAMSEAIRRLQMLGIETGTTIIYLSQMSNESAKENNILNANLKGAGNLVASSDYIFVMKRGGAQGEVEFGLKKNKHGPTRKKWTMILSPRRGKIVLGEEITETSGTGGF